MPGEPVDIKSLDSTPLGPRHAPTSGEHIMYRRSSRKATATKTVATQALKLPPRYTCWIAHLIGQSVRDSQSESVSPSQSQMCARNIRNCMVAKTGHGAFADFVAEEKGDIRRFCCCVVLSDFQGAHESDRLSTV